MNKQTGTSTFVELERYLIKRSSIAGKLCFIEMYEDGTFGWHWDYYDGKKSTFGDQGDLPDITASEKVQNEIKNRNWTGGMSKELTALASELWKRFEIVYRRR